MYVVAGGDHSLAAVHNLGDADGRREAQHMWPDCQGQGMAALPGPSLAAGLQEQDPHKKACCCTTHCPVWLHVTLLAAQSRMAVCCLMGC